MGPFFILKLRDMLFNKPMPNKNVFLFEKSIVIQGTSGLVQFHLVWSPI